MVPASMSPISRMHQLLSSTYSNFCKSISRNVGLRYLSQTNGSVWRNEISSSETDFGDRNTGTSYHGMDKFAVQLFLHSKNTRARFFLVSEEEAKLHCHHRGYAGITARTGVVTAGTVEARTPPSR